MATTIEDIKYDEMISSMCDEVIMREAAKAQCIYIFVEGESEEAVLHILLEECGLDLNKHGIVIANYNGIGNLKSSIRLLRKTLSHDRPIIVTYDDDLAGKREVRDAGDELITYFKIPQSPVVRFSDGSEGGSLEEAFSPDVFIDSSFESDMVFNGDPRMKSDFSSAFDASKPWFSQLARFVESRGGRAASINKIKLCENMAQLCDPIPDTFKKLAALALSLRERYPVKSPNDVDLSFLKNH